MKRISVIQFVFGARNCQKQKHNENLISVGDGLLFSIIYLVPCSCTRVHIRISRTKYELLWIHVGSFSCFRSKYENVNKQNWVTLELICEYFLCNESGKMIQQANTNNDRRRSDVGVHFSAFAHIDNKQKRKSNCFFRVPRNELLKNHFVSLVQRLRIRIYYIYVLYILQNLHHGAWAVFINSTESEVSNSGKFCSFRFIWFVPGEWCTQNKS